MNESQIIISCLALAVILKIGALAGASMESGEGQFFQVIWGLLFLACVLVGGFNIVILLIKHF